LTDTVKDVPTIKKALDWIARDLVRPENESAWPHLQAMEPERSRIELFDMVWVDALPADRAIRTTWQ
jgi:hypothetical protein